MLARAAVSSEGLTRAGGSTFKTVPSRGFGRRLGSLTRQCLHRHARVFTQHSNWFAPEWHCSEGEKQGSSQNVFYVLMVDVMHHHF